MKTQFSWDVTKARTNIKKHGICFETATRVFADPFVVTTQDRIEQGELRWQAIGIVDGHLMLLVAHTVTDDDEGNEAIRIISARRAEPKERRRYEYHRSLFG